MQVVILFYALCMVSGFQHFTDYRCFHFCRRNISHLGRTVNVGICECKPDSMGQVWGDTKLRPGLQLFLVWLFIMFGRKIPLHSPPRCCRANMVERDHAWECHYNVKTWHYNGSAIFVAFRAILMAGQKLQAFEFFVFRARKSQKSQSWPSSKLEDTWTGLESEDICWSSKLNVPAAYVPRAQGQTTTRQLWFLICQD